MSPLGRGFLGALLGALLTLLCHPVSRPFLLQPITRHPRNVIRRNLEPWEHGLGAPRDLADAGLWVQIECSRLAARNKLKAREMQALFNLLDLCIKQDPDNAFWLQVQAVFLAEDRQTAKSARAWTRAAHCKGWNDYQTDRLLRARESLGDELGAKQAWQLGAAYYDRSEACALVIQRYAQSLISRVNLDSTPAVNIRYETVRCGYLLQIGSRSMKVGEHGGNMVELATYPQDLVATATPKRLWIAQTKLLSLVRERRSEQDAQDALRAFRYNESWHALTQPQSPDETAQWLCFGGIFAMHIVTATMLAALVGCLLNLVGRWLAARDQASPAYTTWPIVVSALFIGAAMAITTLSWFASITAGLSTLFLLLGPARNRLKDDGDLGPLFTFMLLAGTGVFVLSLLMYLSGSSIATKWLIAYLGEYGSYLADPNAYLGICGVTLTSLCLIAPTWAIVQRIGTPFVFALTLRRFGAILAMGALFFTVVLTPAAVYLDRQCGDVLKQLVQNEPVYYLTSDTRNQGPR